MAVSSEQSSSRPSRRQLLVAASAVPITAAVPGTAAASTTRATGGARAATTRPRPPVVRSAHPHQRLTEAFEKYGNSGDGWSGGDSTYSRRLPGGRELWMFSDTFLGTVNPDGSRPEDSPFINNSFVQQRGTRMSTIHGGTDADPKAVLPKPAEDEWFWLGASHLGAGTLDVMYLRFARTGDGMWDFAWQETVVARVDPTTLKTISTHPAPSGTQVHWASWIQPHGRHTYVYGVEDNGLDKHMHIARVRGADLRSAWEFYDGSGWSPHESDSARVLTGVSNEYSVTPWRGGYLLVTQDTTTEFSTKILGYVADSPTGPFRSPTLLYTTPETGASGSYGDPNVFTYNPHEHPELRRGNRLLITYNVNSLEFDGILEEVTKYRPRFIEVTLG